VGRLARGENAPEDRAKLERILLATTVEALQAEAGRLSEIDDHGAFVIRLAIGDQPSQLDAAELDLGAIRRNALAIGVGHSHVLAIVRTQSPFDAVERDLLEHLAAQAAVSLENLRLEELAWHSAREQRVRAEEYARIAHTLQRSLLPPELPEIPGVQTGALYRAAQHNEVGGDFYDLFRTGETEWFAVIGDVCGKGPEAAAVTALARYTIRAAVLRHRSPAGILRWVNAALLRQPSGRFVTLACARLDVDKDVVTVTVACGGHPPARVLRATGLVESIGANGTVLGVLEDLEAVDRTTRLASGDSLVLYTDGLTEASAPDVWTPHQLDAAVSGARRLSAQGIVEHLGAQVPGPLRDDLALLAVRVQPLL